MATDKGPRRNRAKATKQWPVVSLGCKWRIFAGRSRKRRRNVSNDSRLGDDCHLSLADVGYNHRRGSRVTVPAVVGHIVTRRIVPYSDLAKHNDVTGFVLASSGGLRRPPGLRVIIAWQAFNTPMGSPEKKYRLLRSLSSRRDLQRAEPWRATPRDRALCRSRAARGVDGDADGPRVG